MHTKNFLKAAILAAVLVIAFIASWEIYLRNKGYSLSYDDGNILWADKRAKVYQPSDRATVFIGSSRNKFDLDIDTWRKLTGEDAVQLAIEGESPTPILDNLANDKNFKGKLVVDVTEGLFFTRDQGNLTTPKKFIQFYKDETPSQKAGFQVNRLLESEFVFLDKNYFSLNGLLHRLPIRDRPGIYGGPDFPWEFSKKTFDRQSKMDPRFVKEPALQKKVQDIWAAFAKMDREKPPTGMELDSFLNVVKSDVDKIRARGGQVLFVRTPSSGPYLEGEKKAFPRTQYWDKILQVTNCPGIHFADYDATSHFVCPEWSHLSPDQAKVWTTNLVQAMQGKGWKFPHQTSPL